MSEAEPSISKSEPCCPRCGYDQRGVLDQWTQQCPTEGTCTECGLIFNWGELLCPWKFEPRWCVEFAIETSRVPAAAAKTAAHSFLPWHFWRTLHMAYPLRPKRLLSYISLLLLPLIVCFVIAQCIATWTTYIAFKIQMTSLNVVPGQSPSSQIQQQIDNLREQLGVYRNPTYAAELPKAFHKTPEEWKTWMDATIEAIEQQIKDLQSQLVSLPPPPPPPPLPVVPILPELIKAICTPLSVRPGPLFTLAGGSIQYPPPIAIHPVLRGMTVRDLLFLLPVMWSPLLLVPAEFILLPYSRRRANVRWRHIGRVLAYSAIVPAIAICLTMLFLAIDDLLSSSSSRPGFFLIGLPTFGVAIGVIIWWAAAISRYLRIPHAWPVAIMLAMIAIGLTSAVVTYAHDPLSPSEIWEWTLKSFE